MIAEDYVWLVWSSAFLAPWLAIYASFQRYRRAMLWASVFTTPFGLTEPLFVPEYWSPPSLFDLARTTGFDVESLIFCFGLGGVGAVLYDMLTGRRLVAAWRRCFSAPRRPCSAGPISAGRPPGPCSSSATIGLQFTAPAGYVERVWNLPALSGLTAVGVPVEELLFAPAFGAYWAGVYEHFMWRTGAPPSEDIGRDPKRHPMD